MQKTLPDGVLVDAVWAAANDHQWHSLSDLAKRVPASEANLAKAVGFLLRYGFAELSLSEGERFRVIADSPAPRDIADTLGSVALMTH